MKPMADVAKKKKIVYAEPHSDVNQLYILSMEFVGFFPFSIEACQSSV